MRVGILTFTSYNYGTFLQAFALKEAIKNLGFNVDIINTTSIRDILRKLMSSYPFFSFKSMLIFSSYWKKINLSNLNFKKFDIIIIGSDTVWDKRRPNIFFGNIQNNNISSYAASCGETLCKDLNKKQIEGLRNINNFSCRDKKTCNMIRELFGKNCIKVLDPTFLIEWRKYEHPIYKDDFILVYSYSGKNRELCIKAKEISKITGKQTVSIMDYIPWCNKNISKVNPFQFLSYIKKADYVITDTFHGTAFSINYRKKFISFPKYNKIKDLLNTFNLDKNKIVQYKGKIDITKSKNYLKHILEETNEN